MQDAINSESYWNGRFASDWDENKGREQTRFFAHLALSHFPEWLLRDIHRDAMTVCDWGCAEGEAVDVFQSHLGVPVIGVDFSESAIEKAKASYPHGHFMCEDYLSGEYHDSYDVIFSSNTLEHFEQPWDVFSKLAIWARRFLVLLLPFREYQRHVEHFATFDFDNIPTIVAGFGLVHARVINSGAMTPSYWPGEQVLLVFARKEIHDELRLRMIDVRIDHPEHMAVLLEMQALKQSELDARNQLRAQSESLLPLIDACKLREQEARDKLRAQEEEIASALNAIQLRELEGRKQLLAQEARITSLAEALDQAQVRLDAFCWQDELKEKLRIEGVLEERSKWLTSLEVELQSLRATLVTSEEAREASEQRRIVAEANLAHSRAQYDQVLSSNSWKIMRPFRHLRRIMFGVKDQSG